MSPEPTIEARPEQPYVGKRIAMAMSDFETRIPALIEEVSLWMRDQGREPDGPPFLRYHVIDMPERLDVELAMPVGAPIESDGEIHAGSLPEGRYAVTRYVGVDNGIAANKALIAWIEAQGEEVVSHDVANGVAFKARYETFLPDARAEPDPERQETEIAIKLRD